MTTVVGYPAGNSLKSGTDGLVPTNVHIGQNKLSTFAKGLREACRLFTGNVQVGSGATLAYATPVHGGYVGTLTTEIPTDADGFFVILANGDTANEVVVTGVSYLCPSDMSQKPFNGVARTNGSFAGSAGVTIPVAPSARLPSFVRSDTTYLSTVARTDDPSSTRRIIHVRVSFAAAANTTSLPFWSRGGARWTTDPTGYDTWTTISAGDQTDNVAGLGTVADHEGGCMIFGLGYLSRGKVRVVGLSGDSFMEGSEEGSGCRSFWVEGLLAASSDSQPIEVFNMSRGGDTTAQSVDRALAVTALYKPTDIIQNWFTPNSGVTAANLLTQRQQVQRMLQYTDANKITPWLATGSPSTNAGNTASNYDAAGRTRQYAYNADAVNYARVIDLASLTVGNKDLGLWPLGASADGVHPQASWTKSTLIPYVTRFFTAQPA